MERGLSWESVGRTSWERKPQVLAELSPHSRGDLGPPVPRLVGPSSIPAFRCGGSESHEQPRSAKPRLPGWQSRGSLSLARLPEL